VIRRLLGRLAGATPTATRVEELSPLRWSVVDERGNRWLLVQTEYSRGDGGGTIVLTLRDEATLRAPRLNP
jgi:hypothetical protein